MIDPVGPKVITEAVLDAALASLNARLLSEGCEVHADDSLAIFVQYTPEPSGYTTVREIAEALDAALRTSAE